MKSLTRFKYTFLLPLIFTLSGCGGGSSVAVEPTPAPAPKQEAGGFQAISTAVTSSQSAIQSVIDYVSDLGLTVHYDVKAYKLEYWTFGPDNNLIKVSGMIAVPQKATPSPILSYQHPTLLQNSDAPSLNLEATGDGPEVTLASLGYIVFSADYIGYGITHGQPHPYLQKQPSADVVVDLLRAGKTWLDYNSIPQTGELFMTGYSQGGYVTMSAVQYLQANPGLGLIVNGAVYGAGPYDVFTAFQATLDKLPIEVDVGDIPPKLAGLVVDQLKDFILGDRTDINFDMTVLERFIVGDRQDDVHDWLADIPVKLFHGIDDETVPVESAYSTRDTMTGNGADVELVLCDAQPSEHLACVRPYVNYLVDYFANLQSAPE